MLSRYLAAAPGPEYVGKAGDKLPLWAVEASSGLGIRSDVPPVFQLADFVWQPGTPAGSHMEDRESGTVEIQDPPTPGGWAIRSYGVPYANIPYYQSDPNYLYTLGGSAGFPPREFVFGVKTGPDQGILWAYQYDPAEGVWLPVGTTGMIGGRNTVFDTNAFQRASNRMGLIVILSAVGGYFLAPAGAAAGAGEAGAGAALEAGAATVPEYIGPGSSIAAGGGDIAAQTAYAAGTESLFSAGATSGAWDALLQKAIDAGGKLAVGKIASAVMPGKKPAQQFGVQGERRLADGTRARANPDGSITITDPDGTERTIGAGGQVTGQWLPGVTNLALLGFGLTVLSLLLRR